MSKRVEGASSISLPVCSGMETDYFNALEDVFKGGTRVLKHMRQLSFKDYRHNHAGSPAHCLCAIWPDSYKDTLVSKSTDVTYIFRSFPNLQVEHC